MTKKSPLAPKRFPSLPAIPGVMVAGAACGLKKAKVPDLFLAQLDKGATIAGVFTRSKCFSAPVAWCRKALSRGKVRAIVVNSGNANAFTGNAGDKTVEHTVKAAARLFACPQWEVFVASTGVIGEPVKAAYISTKLPGLKKQLKDTSWKDAAAAIMTTDTFAKGVTASTHIGGVPVTINAIAKGSGMIAPDMATMLAFIFTDAKIPGDVLQALLSRINERTFNSITVDSDTSTSDTVLLAATGKGAKHAKITSATGPLIKDFAGALEDVMRDLAIQIVRDGEGAEKLLTIDVTGAVSNRSAKVIALAIANSPLVKTAIAGEDANWGRVVMAVGKAGETADRDRISISMGGVEITRNGQRLANYDETPVAAHLKGREVCLAVDLGLGKGKSRVWTCDLTHGYININADYRS